MSERLIFARRFSDGCSCNVEILSPLPTEKGLSISTQNFSNELEQWFDKDGKPEPYRVSERIEHHNIFSEYRDWFVSVIIPSAAEKWNLPVTLYLVGWRPHQQEHWRCNPGEKPVQLALSGDPETGKPIVTRHGDDDQTQRGSL